MKDDEKKPFYAGVRPCGCITALMVDDETTSRSDVTAFEADMVRSGRKCEHRMLTRAEFDATFHKCPHMQPNDKVTRRTTAHDFSDTGRRSR